MAACSTASSLCVGVRGEGGRLERGPPLRPDSFSFSRCLSSALPTLSRARTLCQALRYLRIQIPDFLSLSRYYNTATRLEPLYSVFFLTYLLYHVLCQGPSVAYVCNGPPTPGVPRWVSNTYLHGRGTTVSVRLTRSTHHDRRQHLRRQHLRRRRRHRRRHAGRTKFIPPNDFITLPRTFNTKLLLRPDSLAATRRGGQGAQTGVETVGATLIYAPVKTAYPESKDLARFHRPRALLSVSKRFLKLREDTHLRSSARVDLNALVD